MTKNNPPTRQSIPNETLPSSSGGIAPSNNGVRKTSTPTYDFTSGGSNSQESRNTTNAHHHHGRDRSSNNKDPLSPTSISFSPAGTYSAGNDTPMLTMTSPDPSIIAIHGSVMTNFPMPRGGKHEVQGMGEDDWFKMASNIKNGKKNSISSIVPQTPIEEHKDRLLQEPKNSIQVDKGQVEKGKAKEEVNEKDTEKGKPIYKNDRIIAIDFDDVFTQNKATITEQHNIRYGTDLTPDVLQTYVLWQNKGWGTPAEVARKIRLINETLLPLTPPISGFAEGLKEINGLGHEIHIITSRSLIDKEGMQEWLLKQGITIGNKSEDVIKDIHFTGTYGEVYQQIEDANGDEELERKLNEKLKELWKDGLGKGKILREINASLFIDDLPGNLEPIINATPPIKCQCLLFGEYGWNKYKSGLTSSIELMDYDERIKNGLVLPLNEIEFGKEKNLFRVKNWGELVDWVKEWDREAVDAVCYDT